MNPVAHTPVNSRVRRRQQAYWAIAILLTAAYLPLMGLEWKSSVALHTLMESVATVLALLTGTLALIRYYSRKEPLFIFIGAAFIGTGMLDLYHAVVTSAWFSDKLPSGLDSLIPWSWTASRLYLALFLFISWQQTRNNHKPLDTVTERNIYLIGLVMTLGSFVFFAFVPLPQAYFDHLIWHRPEEFLPATLFAIALWGFLRQGKWQDNIFHHWLIICLLVNLISQLVFMPYSSELFDMEFDVAHLLKKASYIAALTGLLLSMFKAYKQLEEEQLVIERQSSELQESREWFRIIANYSATWELWKGPDGKVWFSSPACEELTGYSADDFVSGRIKYEDILHKQEKLSVYRHLADMHIEKPAEDAAGDIDLRIVTRDGKTRWINHICRPIYNEHGVFLGQRSSNRDITERKRAEERMRLLNLALEYSPESIFITDSSGVIVYVNPKFTEMTGYSPEEAIGSTPAILKSGEQDDDYYRHMWSQLSSGISLHSELLNRRRNGELFWVSEMITPIFRENREIQYFIAIMEDITEKKKQSREIFERANFDALTGIYNRAAFEEKAQQELMRARRKSLLEALLLIDLDYFKAVNDSFGHDAGDILLINVTQRIREVIRESDLFGRLGGDEFAIMLELDVKDQVYLERVCQRILTSLQQPFVIKDQEVRIGCSIGVALFPEHGDTYKTLYNNADKAVYSVKGSGRGDFFVFEASI